MKPIVLLAATTRWFPTARLGMGLAAAGFKVEAICPSRHPIERVTCVARTHPYHGLAPLQSFGEAIAAAEPHLVIPCDDLAALHLQQLYYRENGRGKSEAETCKLIERSMGPASSFPIVSARAAFMDIAEQEGVRAPKTRVLATIDDLRSVTAQFGFPVVLKTDGTSGGDGVSLARTPEEAAEAFRLLGAPPLLARAVKRALVNHDLTLLGPSLRRTRGVVNAQAFAPGGEATTAVACWQGTVLAILHFEVLNKRYSTGPATVLRLIENDDMSIAAERMVRRLELSGIHGFDFMLETETGNAHLLEINPRATQFVHLALGRRHDIPAALYAAVTGEPTHESPAVTEKDTITLFPHEWLRNPASPFLQTSYHDVPWEEPELIRLCVGTRQKQRDLYSQQKWAQTLEPAEAHR